MRMKLLEDYDDKRRKGYEMEIDKIRYSPNCVGNFAVRVVGEWSEPTYMAITWFVRVPDDF